MSKYIIRMRNENDFECNVYTDRFGLTAWNEKSKYLAIKGVIDAVKFLTGETIKREDIFTDWSIKNTPEENAKRLAKKPRGKGCGCTTPFTEWRKLYDQMVADARQTASTETKELSFGSYTEQALSTALNLDKDDITYPVLGLAGESGEVAEKVKKIIRDKGGVVTDEDRKAIAIELSDVLWYVNRMAWGMGYTLEEVAKLNIAKLKSRQSRGVLQGSGDSR